MVIIDFKQWYKDKYFETDLGYIICSDCLEVMGELIHNRAKFDTIIADIPYGTTACKWDSVIPFKEMWDRLHKLIKFQGAICLFGSEPFSSNLRISNIKNYKYDWYWIKSKPNGFQHSKNRPMMKVETISVFSLGSMGHKSLLGNKRMHYYPQGIKPVGIGVVKDYFHGRTMGARPNQVGKKYIKYTNFPHNVLEYSNIVGKKAIHPTQKPVDLIEYLIKTYTLEDDIILDFTAGSMTTGLAAEKLNRRWICIEKEEKYCKLGKNRFLK